jgi:polyether ionophore transport system ATP-binding protein
MTASSGLVTSPWDGEPAPEQGRLAAPCGTFGTERARAAARMLGHGEPWKERTLTESLQSQVPVEADVSPVVSAQGLVKSFRHVRALDGLDLTVLPGEVHGFLGPNGAGKTTTLRILLGLLRADAGDVRLFGEDPWRDPVGLHRRLAYVPGDVSLWPNLSGGETVDLLLRMRGLDPAAGRKDELVERFRLDLTTRARAYSRGNRQKVALVAALAADTDLLVLDEPTSGLDPLMEAVFRDCLAEHRARGATVLLSSHILSEVERLADRVTIIRDGRTVESGTLANLRLTRHATPDASLEDLFLAAYR